MAPPVVGDRAKLVHKALIEAGLEGVKIKRQEFEAILTQELEVGFDAMRSIIRTGELLGLWTCIEGGSKKGSLRIHAPSGSA